MPKEYRVEKIIASRVNKGRQEYQIKWEGYPMSQCTWQPEEHLQYCLDMVRDFNKKKKTAQMTTSNARTSQGKNGFVSKGQMEATQSSDEGEKEWNGKNKGKNGKAQKTISRPPRFASSKKQPETYIINEDQEDNEQERNQVYDQKPNADIEDDTNEDNIHILGLHSDQNENIYYKIRKNGVESNIPRDELIKLNVHALLEFYEEHLEFQPINCNE